MKKIFTLLFTFLVSFSFGQSVQLLYQGQPYSNNDTIFITLDNPSIEENKIYVDIANTSEEVFSLMVRKQELVIIPGSINSFCFNNNCYSGSQSTEPYNIQPNDTLAYSKTPLQAFYLEYLPNENTGVSVIKYNFYNNNRPNDNVNLNFYIDTKQPTGTKDIKTTSSTLKAYPNPASSQVNIQYDVKNTPLNGDLKLVIKNIMGATMTVLPLSQTAATVTVDISEIPSGLYFYSIESSGRILMTKKLMVK